MSLLFLSPHGIKSVTEKTEELPGVAKRATKLEVHPRWSHLESSFSVVLIPE